jgi:hypothetical protein
LYSQLLLVLLDLLLHTFGEDLNVDAEEGVLVLLVLLHTQRLLGQLRVGAPLHTVEEYLELVGQFHLLIVLEGFYPTLGVLQLLLVDCE